MAQKAPGKAHREGVSLAELFLRFPNDAAAQAWLEEQRWGGEPWCPHCGSFNVRHNNHRSMPWRCAERECRKRFSVRSGTPMQGSPLGYQIWVIAIYLLTTSLKGQSSMKLHRDLKVTQKTAWFLAHRIRKTFDDNDEDGGGHFAGPVEVDETYMGGKRKNMSNAKRKALTEQGAGRGSVGKTAIVGVKDRATKQVRAKVVERTDATTLQGFVIDHTAPDATVYTDEASAYEGLPMTHASVKHSVKEYVRGQVHTNGMESFWSMMKRGYIGIYHKMSPKHLGRYVSEFAGRHNLRDAEAGQRTGFGSAGVMTEQERKAEMMNLLLQHEEQKSKVVCIECQIQNFAPPLLALGNALKTDFERVTPSQDDDIGFLIRALPHQHNQEPERIRVDLTRLRGLLGDYTGSLGGEGED